ncbi:MAG TPA: hypothetical protein VHU19_02080 [Pyrinomonadaceae bacterium]|nr:hypothetical protein [Pyrinomonadaceae bacterium]
MKHSYRLSRFGAALFALVLLLGASAGARAQTLSPTPDNLILQVTNTSIPAVPTPTPSPTPTPTPTPTGTPLPLPRNSFAGDVSGNGRFVVIESEGDIATERTAARNNADGNSEIFLFDYAQRRIFQITNTKNALINTGASPIDPTNIDVRVVNLRPVMSHDGRFIVFISNAYSDASPALSPANFDGNANAAALHTDGNTEIFIYQIPQAPEVDLTSGTEVAPVDLSTGTMTRITFTPASALPRPGATNVTPFFALDNDAPAVNDDASFIAFVSQSKAGIPGESNADGNQEIFIFNRLTGTFVQVTNTLDTPPTSSNPLGTLVFNNNPSLSGSGNVLAFISNADIGTSEAAANKGNGEIYVANFSGSAVSGLRAVTQTPHLLSNGAETGVSVNLLNPGRRLSRDGKLLAFESLANFNADGSLPSTPLAVSTGIYIYNLTANTFTLVASRPPSDQTDVGERWPTFTGDSTRIVWSSVLNLKADGTALAINDATGLNLGDRTQVFTAPVSALNQVSRLTNQPNVFAPLQPFPADDIRRVALSLTGELGGGNTDLLSEVFYVLTPNVTSETPAPSPTPAASPAPVTFSTGASDAPVVSPTPAPTPPAVTGLAPGMLGIINSTLTLAPAQRQVDPNNAHEVKRRPPLPIELNGVSVSVSGAAAGLYFVAPNQINFVVPVGLAASTTAQPVVIFNNGALIRTSVQLNPAQPDIFTSTNGAGGRAAVLNVTNPCVAPSGEPFAVTTTIPKGSQATGDCTSTDTETVPTRLLIMLTGVRGVTTTSSVTVNIGTTAIVGTADLVAGPVHFVGPSLTPGFDQIIVELPAALAGAGDVPVVVSVTTSAGTFTSRPADSAPHITIR